MSKKDSAVPSAWWWAAISGFMVGASYPPAILPLTAGPGLVLFLLSMRLHRAGDNPAVPVLLHVATAWGGAFFWVGSHVIPHVAATSIVVLLALVMLVTAVSTTGFKIAGLPGLIVGHLAVEMALTYGPVPMPWISAGFTVSGTALEPVVALYGVTGASACLWAAAFVFVGRRPWTRTGLAVFLLVMTLCLLAIASWSRSDMDLSTHRKDVRVLVVQPDLRPDAWADIHSWSRMDTLARLSTGHNADLIVWPETALPLLSARELPEAMTTAWRADSVSWPLLTGGIVRPSDPAGATPPWNAAILFNAHSPTRVYAKQKLVPFAEYVPGSNWIPGLSALAVPAGGADGYSPGVDAAYWSVAGWTMAPMICFESVFSAVARRHARNGADVLVVLSQTGWWTFPRAARQHVAYSALAARSAGRPMVVSSVNGPSGVVNAKGQLVAHIPQGTSSAVVFPVRAEAIQTPYAIVGEWPAWVIFGLLFVVSVRNRLLHRLSPSS